MSRTHGVFGFSSGVQLAGNSRTTNFFITPKEHPKHTCYTRTHGGLRFSLRFSWRVIVINHYSGYGLMYALDRLVISLRMRSLRGSRECLQSLALARGAFRACFLPANKMSIYSFKFRRFNKILTEHNYVTKNPSKMESVSNQTKTRRRPYGLQTR